MYITDERKPLVFSLIILGLTALSALVPIISSSFYTQSDSLFLIFLTALILTVSVCAASFFDTFTVFGFALAPAMMIASTAAIPLLFFTSAYSDEAVYSFTTECFSAALVTVVAVPATWLMILVVNAMRKNSPL